jgi:hypothetical protein
VADDKNSNAPGKPQEEPILARLKRGSSQTPTGVTSFVGLLGRSPKPGYWLLYTGLDMSRSVEIQEADIVHSEQLASDQSPFGSLGGTRVFVKQDAQVTTTRTAWQTQDASEAAGDEFDLDIRLGSAGPASPREMFTRATCPGKTCKTECDQGTCVTCNTCNTQCLQPTCVITQCDQGTCVTCHTCNTKCGQHTCACHVTVLTFCGECGAQTGNTCLVCR